MKIKSLDMDGFKGFNKNGTIQFSNINLFFGANSSGKSTAIQALMLLKQTLESKSDQFDLLLNGKYINLGSPGDIIYKDSQNSVRSHFSIGLELNSDNEFPNSINEVSNDVSFNWTFKEDKNKINNICLNEIDVKIDDKSYAFKMKLDEGFFAVTNNKLIYKIKMNNLTPSKIVLKYNIRINRLLHNLLDEVYELIVKHDGTEKKIKWNKELDFVDEYRNILNAFFDINKGMSTTQTYNPSFESLVIELTEIINNVKNELHANKSNDILEFVIKSNLYYLSNEDQPELKEIITKYLTEYNNIINNQNLEDLVLRSKSIQFYNNYFNEESNNEIIEIIEAKKSLERTLSRIWYLGPIRERPKSIYEYESDQNPKYVGKYGQNLPGILAYFSELKIEAPMPNGEIIRKIRFIDALNEWIKFIGIGDDIYTKVSNVFSVNIHNRGIESNIVNVGVGVSQALPVIAMGLLSNRTDILIYEQPELHLHPYAQSKLIDFFVLLSKKGNQIIIESHSEYFLHRLRYKIINEDIKQEQINLLFFDNRDNGVAVKKAKLGEFGEIEYPIGFKDETEALIDELLEKQLDRLKNG